MDEFSVRPETRAGDRFFVVGMVGGADHDGDDDVEVHYSGLERKCGCFGGVVYLTYEEDGCEWIEPVPCRRCNR